jgi:ABC-2 type transport system ATP-binding protein
MLPALDIRDLRFSYGQGYAVDGITLQIEEGLFFGLLGPNGAGKSTTIQMLCALLPPHKVVSAVLAIRL